MDLISDIELICSKEVEEVLNSSLLLKLLNVYSILYLNGGQPNTCSKCHRDYYAQIKSNGLTKLQSMSENLKKTCELVSKDIIYIQPLHAHISNISLTDELAIRCLENKWLRENDFEKLPEGYKTKSHPDVLESEETAPKKRQVKQG